MSHSRTKTSGTPSRDGITLFEGDVSEFDGKVTVPGGLEIAQYEGLVLCWDYNRSEKEVVLQAERRTRVPILRIPLTEQEVQIIHNHQEKGGWGFYDLHVEENDDRAAVNVSFITADQEPTSLLWIIDKNRRTAVREALNRLYDKDDPVFDD
ncbi:MAG TPA: hypothetical protein VIC28_05225 [Thermoanaerobaculia bacterium]|jgi:hypothetical protein